MSAELPLPGGFQSCVVGKIKRQKLPEVRLLKVYIYGDSQGKGGGEEEEQEEK